MNKIRPKSAVDSIRLNVLYIGRACDFFELLCFRAPHQMCFKPQQKPSSCLPRHAVGAKRLADLSHNEAFIARSRRTPAMLVRRCYSELFGHKDKSHNPLSGRCPGFSTTQAENSIPPRGSRLMVTGSSSRARSSSSITMWPESSKQHLRTSIAGVLRLRAINASLCDRSARRSAQDDDFVGRVGNIWCVRKSHRLSGRRLCGRSEEIRTR